MTSAKRKEVSPGNVASAERAAADNVKRVVRGPANGQRLADIEQLLELKTVWHPIGV